AALAVGLVAGFAIGRGGGVVSAQVGGRVDENAGAAEAARSAQVRKSDGDVYNQLAREYDKFAQVDRMFELVAKAVSPTVVHIATEKGTRHEESQRVRKFEETGSGVIVRCEKEPGLYVLTNHHVVEGGKTSKVRIFLQDGRALVPQRIWSD